LPLLCDFSGAIFDADSGWDGDSSGDSSVIDDNVLGSGGIGFETLVSSLRPCILFLMSL